MTYQKSKITDNGILGGVRSPLILKKSGMMSKVVVIYDWCKVILFGVFSSKIGLFIYNI